MQEEMEFEYTNTFLHTHTAFTDTDGGMYREKHNPAHCTFGT